MTTPKPVDRINALPQGVCNDLGFTLVELLVVVTIMGVLISIAIESFATIKAKVRNTRCISEVRLLEKEILAYAYDRGSLPPDLETINRKDLTDPWGNRYIYAPAAEPVAPGNIGLNNRSNVTTLNSDFDLFSMGPDGNWQTSINDAQSQDDIIRADNGNFVGIVKDYP